MKKKSVTLVVKRGALRRFDRLKREAAQLSVDVIWDRREGERRGADSQHMRSRRKVERRQHPGFIWDVADFAVAEKGGKERKK